MSSRKKHSSSQKSQKTSGVQDRPKATPEQRSPKKAPRLPLPNPDLILPILLGITFILILISRVQYLPIPFDRDEGAYGYLGWMALSGGKPYVDFFEMKPPLLFYSFAVIIALFGKSTVGLHLAATLLNIACTWFVYRLGHGLWKSRGAGAIAAMSFFILGAHPFATGYAMQSEHVLLVFALPGLLFTYLGASTENKLKLLTGGILLACSALVKQNGIFFCAAGLLIVLIHAMRPKLWKSKKTLTGILYFSLGGLLPVCLSLLILWLVGSFHDFWYWIYEYPQKYLSSVTASNSAQLFDRAIDGLLYNHAHWFIAGFAGLLLLPFGKILEWRSKASLFIIALLSACTVIPGMRFYGHYWLLVFPAVALLIPAIFIVIPGFIRNSRWQEITKLIIILGLTCLLAFHFYMNQGQYYKPDFQRVLLSAHKGNYFYIHKEIGDLLNTRMQPEDQLMVLGSEPQLYLYTEKKSPTRHFYTSFTSKAIPEALEWQDEVIKVIQNRKPEYMVLFIEQIAWMFQEDSTRRLYNWAYNHMLSRYTPIAYAELSPQGTARIVEVPEGQTYEPVTGQYVIISKRKP